MAPSVSCLLLEWPDGERDGWELGGASSAGSAAGAHLADMEWRAVIYLVKCWGLMDRSCLAKGRKNSSHPKCPGVVPETGGPSAR